MSNLLKKITSIEPDETDILNAIDGKADKPPKKGLFISSIEETRENNDPVPTFITRENEPAENPIDDAAPHKLKPQDSNPDNPTPSDKVSNPLITSSAGLIAPSVLDETIDAPTHSWMLWTGFIAALLWAAASFSYFYGFFELRQKWTDLSPIQISGLIMAIIFPAILLAMFFYVLRQLSKISAQSERLERAANKMNQPDETLIAKSSLMSQAIKKEVDTVDTRIDQALARMGALEDVLNERTKSLEDATGNTAKQADEISFQLATQKQALKDIAGTFDSRMQMLSSSLTENTAKLDGSTKIAEQKIQEARISVEDAAKRIDSVSEVVKENALNAASTLTKSHVEIESLSTMLKERSTELDNVYKKHAQDLTAMIAELRDEQQNLSLSLDERLSKMRDMSLSAKVSAENLIEASEAGRNTVNALAEATRLTDTAVKKRFAEMEDMVKFSSEKAANISDQASQRVQDRLAQTRREISLIEDDMLILQNKLSAPSQPQKELDLTKPTQPNRKRKSRLKLNAADEDEHTEPHSSYDPSELEIPSLRGPAPTRASSYSESDLNLELDDEILEPNNPIIPDEDLLITPQNTTERNEILAPIRAATETKKDKTGWRWRDMLGGLDKPSSQPKQQNLNTSATPPRDVSNHRMIASLSALGLSPAAIIDDGCIIEATNTRRSKGAMAMSQTIAHRIGDPIRHLYRSMEKNPALKTDAQIFTAKFNTNIQAVESDREAIRNYLESDAGRAYLLCDAALNG